tara:strand:- start:1154 stop:1789 length:636 start_codon:yes stop_codon:yes gene_type:complete
MMLSTTTISLENFFQNAFQKAIISDDRKSLLRTISKAIAEEYKLKNVVNLNFICTHNSRRSQLGQVWSFYAAHYFNLNINAFSGGTEVTAFYRNTVKTLQKVGFEFQLVDFSHQNPTYQITIKNTKKAILGFSKLYSNPINTAPFMAITTCNNADVNCPFIPNASYRFHVPFVDPKHADKSEKQEEIYLQTSQQIAGEVYFIFADVKKLLQ